MIKPNDYDNVQGYGEYEALELGGHIMKIVNVEETVSSTGKPMIKIYLDTDKSDKQPQYFKARYDSNARANKKWPCVVCQLVYDDTGATNRGLKAFHECVEKSNESKFKLLWGDKYCECFKGKLIGGVFGREEFIASDGSAKWTTKCFFFRSVGVILKGVPVPEDKSLGGNKPVARQNVVVQAQPGELPIPGDDDDYPF